MIQRYVDTASTAGGDGTTTALTGANRAFASLLEAVNSLPTTLTDQTTITCAASTGVADTTPVDSGPFDQITTAAFYLKIEAASTDRAEMPINTSKYRMAVTNSNAIYNNIPSHYRIDGIQVILTVTDASSYVGFKSTNQNQVATDIHCEISNCVVQGIISSGSVVGFTTRFPDITTGAGNSYVYNCVAYNTTTAFNSDWDGGGGYYNCTAYGNSFSFIEDLGQPNGNVPMVCKNCLSAAAGGGDGFIGTFTGSSNNASDDASAPGTSSRTNQTFSFANASGRDLHLQATDAGAKGFGVSAPAGAVFSTDFDGQTRTGSWDIGADQTVAATVALTGTVTASITEADIVAGGKTAIFTVTGDTFVPTVQTPTIGFISQALGGTATTTSFTVTIPQVLAGDLMILSFTHRGTGDGVITGTYGGTFTKKFDSLYATSAFSGLVYYSRATANHAGETVIVSSLTNACAGVLTVYRNVLAAGDPFDGAATSVAEQNASGDETQAQITTLVDGAMVCLEVYNSPDVAVASQACTSPGALVERAERLSTGGTDASIAHASELKTTAGATGAFTWAQVNGISGSIAYALQPDSSTPFANARAAMRDGGDSAQAEAAGYDAKVTPNIPLANIVRTANDRITITFHAQADYNITAQETITWTIPATMLSSAQAVVATPTFTIATGGAAGLLPLPVVRLQAVSRASVH